MDRIENVVCESNNSSTKAHISFPIHYSPMGRILLKRILTGVYSNKCYKINFRHLDVHKHV